MVYRNSATAATAEVYVGPQCIMWIMIERKMHHKVIHLMWEKYSVTSVFADFEVQW